MNGRLLASGMLPGLLGYRLRLAQQVVFRDFAKSVAELSPGRVGILLLAHLAELFQQRVVAELRLLFGRQSHLHILRLGNAAGSVKLGGSRTTPREHYLYMVWFEVPDE